jgi:carboxylesterase
MIHGLTGTPWVFHELKELFEKKGFIVLTPLLPGHGTTPKDLNRVIWKEWIDCARKAYDELASKCGTIFILGLSMGGAIAFYLASEVPCQGVISLSAPVRFRKFWAWTLPIMKLFVRYRRKNGVSNTRLPEEVGYDCYPLSSVSQMLRLLSRMRPRLKEIHCPVLIMHSKEDAKVSARNADLLYDGIRSTVKQKILLNHPAHVITKGENFEQVADEALKFIRENGHSV